MKPLFLIGVAVCLCASGCDSKNPLSDPLKSKADERLAGVWRDRSSAETIQVGHVGVKFPKGVMRISGIIKFEGKERPAQCLAFPTAIGNKTYLNVVLGETQIQLLDKEGWKADMVTSYMLLKYQLDGDKLVVFFMDAGAKVKAIKTGKIKGTVENNSATFTDTTENLAKFVAEAGDSLWNTSEPGQLERVNPGKKP
jgi:hypothetical protein